MASDPKRGPTEFTQVRPTWVCVLHPISGTRTAEEATAGGAGLHDTPVQSPWILPMSKVYLPSY
ncbi:MAG TPA: hypothetical protein VGS18_00515, partial [Thermoplasmata archaeon]|nr:hypothetical protein [Thermoplasmata archaeon]